MERDLRSFASGCPPNSTAGMRADFTKTVLGQEINELIGERHDPTGRGNGRESFRMYRRFRIVRPGEGKDMISQGSGHRNRELFTCFAGDQADSILFKVDIAEGQSRQI